VLLHAALAAGVTLAPISAASGAAHASPFPYCDKYKAREDLVFTDMRGGVLRNSNWRARVFDPAVAKCQKTDETFPSITPNDLRHTAASLAVSAGANVKALQRMLGHAKASMTLDTYADLFDEDLDSVAASLDAAIMKASSAAIAAASGGSAAPPLLPGGSDEASSAKSN
jgi:integrase